MTPTQHPEPAEVVGLTEGEREALRIKAAQTGMDSAILFVERILTGRLAAVMSQQPFRVAETNRLRAESAEAERDTARREADDLRARLGVRVAEFDRAAAMEVPGDPHDSYRRMAYQNAAAALRADLRTQVEEVDIAAILGAHLPGDYTHLFFDDPAAVTPPVGCRCGWRQEPGVSQHDHLGAIIRAALANPSATEESP